MKFMQKIVLIIFLFLCGVKVVNASRTVCIYKIGKSTVTINYDYSKEPDVKITDGVAESASDHRKVEKVEGLKNSDFVDNGSLICPVLNATSRRPYEKNKYKLTLQPNAEDKYGSFSGLLSILENDGLENGGIIEEKIECVYKKGTPKTYTLKWENEKVVVYLTGSAYLNYCKDDTTVNQEDFSATDFLNGNCPDVYDQEVNKHQNLSGSCKGKLIISKSPILTQNDVVTKNDNAETDINVELEKINYSKVTCDTLFGSEASRNSTHGVVKSGNKIMQYLAVILAVVLSVLDFIKVVPTQDKDMLRKAIMKAVTRLGIAIAIFLVPVLLKFVLELIGISEPLCGLI